MMSRCVPNWDASGHRHNPEAAGSVAQNVILASKSKVWDHQEQQFCGRHEVPEHVPGYDEVAELTWVDGHLALQGLVSKAPNRHHYRSSGLGCCYWGNDNDDQASATTRSARHEKEVDGTLDAIVMHEASRCDITARPDAMPNLPTLVDDMVSWFQHPFNDFSQQDAANAAELPRKIIEEDITIRGKCTESTVRCVSEAQQIAAANTESLDALVPLHVDTAQCNNSTRPTGSKARGAEVDQEEEEEEEEEEVPARANANGSMNFSHFSRPAVMMKANLHVLGAASGPTNTQRVRQQCGPMDEPHQPRHRQRDAGNVCASDGNVPVSIVGSTNGLRTHSFASGEISGSASLHIPRKAARALPSQRISDDCIAEALDQDPRRNYTISGSAATIASEMPSETCDAQDFTLTSTSGCSPNDSTEKRGKETRWKRKSLAEEDSGCQSEDVEDESAQTTKKSQARRSSSAKRSRAAAVHNLSERRRRDRINERMKALQKLIPNCSKTDKASMLDEAIEYLKHLQAQLQMMSFRSGLNIPPVMMPLGMQPLQMSLLASLGQMGLGMGVPGVGLGMGMGMGMGMMDMNSIAAAGCGIVPMKATASHALQPATFVQPNIGAFPAASADANDAYTPFMICQRQPTNMEVYNSVAQLHRHLNHCSPQQESNAGKSS